MKRPYLIAGIALAAIIAARVPFAQAQSDTSGESIPQYVVSLSVESSGILHVSEDITYDFGPDERHGIFRNIPIYPSGWPELSVDVQTVTDPASGTTYPFTTGEDSSGDLQVKVGDPNILVTGTKTYEIDYNVSNAIRSFPDHDELYWNAIGTDWTVPIYEASATVAMPFGIPSSSISTYCYTGAQDSQSQDCTVGSDASGNITVSVPNGLTAYEGLTISVSVPKGYISNTVTATPGSTGPLSSAAFPFILFIVVWLVIFVIGIVSKARLASKRAVVPKELKHVPIAPYYSAPDDLPPARIGYADNRTFDASDFTSIILDLAVRGFIKIRYIPKDGFFSREDYELTALKPYDPALPPECKPAYDLFFGNGGNVVRLSTVGNMMGISSFRLAQQLVQSGFDQAGYGTHAKIDGRMLGSFLAGGLVLAGLIRFFALNQPLVTLALVAVFVVASILMAMKFREKFTPQGIELMRKILGYKLFLTYTEADRLKLMDAPKLSPEDFEKTLPYAIALGIEKQWSQQFQSLTLEPPRWIEDPRYQNGFNAGLFVASFGSFNSAMRSSITPRGSGAGGGGSVGGGGGGGGGGSW